MSNSELLDWLGQWYAQYCNGDWEQENEISIETTDDGGWAVNIDAWETPLENKPLAPIDLKKSPTDWVRIKVEQGEFTGAGDISKLNLILSTFRKWVQSPG